MGKSPRIVLIHATSVAVDPVREAFGRLWPEARTVNLLEDSLSQDRVSAELDAAFQERFDRLADYAVSIGADGILFTCSAFGPLIETIAGRLPIPVLKPNEAMFEAALNAGQRIGMIATFAPAAATMEAEFEEDARRLRPDARLALRIVPAAMDALRRGDADTHNALVSTEAHQLEGIDALMLAHFSTARALEACRARVAIPVLSSPETAVWKLRSLIDNNNPGNPGR
jgi:Asp/Glu/hydantoin racemase